MNLFDHARSQAAKDTGMKQAAENNASLLRYARCLALELGERMESVTADDVQAALVAKGISPRALGNAAGSLFRGDEWEWTGRFVASTRVHAHGNLLRSWRLKQ